MVWYIELARWFFGPAVWFYDLARWFYDLAVWFFELVAWGNERAVGENGLTRCGDARTGCEGRGEAGRVKPDGRWEGCKEAGVTRERMRGDVAPRGARGVARRRGQVRAEIAFARGCFAAEFRA